MKYVFSKEKFIDKAPKGVRRQLETHLDTLNGREVIFDARYGSDGIIKQYLKDGQPYYLYPVYKEWCEQILDGQMTIFDYLGGEAT